MVDSHPIHSPSAEAHILVDDLAPARRLLARLWIYRAIGLLLVGQASLLVPLPIALALSHLGIAKYVWAVALVSLVLFFFGFRLLTPQFSLLFLRRFDDDVVGKRVRSLLPRRLTPYFKILALHDPATNPLSTGLADFVGTVGVAIAIAPLAFGLEIVLQKPSLPIWILLPLLILSEPITRKVTLRLESRLLQRTTYNVSNREGLAKTVQAVERWFVRHVVAPKAKVVRVVPDLWQDLVLELAVRADVVIVDVSTIGEGVAWEVEALLPRLDGRVVLFGSEEAVREWLYQGDSSEGDPACRIRPHLSGRQVLVERKGWLGQMRFRRALSRAALSVAMVKRT